MEDSYIALSKYFKKPDFTLGDFSACLGVFIIILLVAKFIQVKNGNKSYYRKYFMPGLMLKMLGGLAYALVYTYYYTYGGDTSGYWKYGSLVANIIFEYPQYWWDVFTANFDSSEPFVIGFLKSFRWSRSTEEFTVIQITSLVAPFGFMNFYASTILLAAICYTGVWQLFLLFRSKFPSAEKLLAIVVLFFPSIVFWGSGIMKDTIVFSCLGLLVYNLNKLFENGFFQFNRIAILILAVVLIFSTKPYVLFSLAPGIVVWRTFKYRDRIKSKFIRATVVPIFIIIAFIGSLYLLDYIGRYNPLYKLENFIGAAQSMQNWHYQEGHNTSEQFGRGSSYSLGDYEPTPLGVAKVFPAAVNVTLFRPYVWEADTFMQLIAALESFAVLLYSFYVIIWLKPSRFFRILNSDSFLLLMLSFSLIFAFAVGFSAYNFGALARYKIPCIPFYLGLLVVIHQRIRQEKREKFMAAILRRRKQRNKMVVPGFTG